MGNVVKYDHSYLMITLFFTMLVITDISALYLYSKISQKADPRSNVADLTIDTDFADLSQVVASGQPVASTSKFFEYPSFQLKIFN